MISMVEKFVTGEPVSILAVILSKVIRLVNATEALQNSVMVSTFLLSAHRNFLDQNH